ncbi:MAG: protein kinase [Polyangiaceae bacterium]|nr:protein kinase [Polyangiaceae bacterium]
MSPSVPSILVADDVQGDVVHQYVEGEVIADKYRLERPLGAGGMGSVWHARNLALDSDVAIKVILNDQHRAQLADRLVREARASARMTHPSIVRVFDVGTTRHGDPFLVMELLKGQSLADYIIRNGRLSATRAVQLLLPIVDALDSAHARGIIHRDLKPDNIFLAENHGQLSPKVLDFGVAMDLSQADHRITQAGTLLGSPAYMSPEQARGEQALDQGTDIWSFCVMLYETLTAQTPFGDDGNYHALLRRIIEEEPTPTHQLVAGDVALWSIIERGFRKKPKDRWPSMRALGVALAEWLESHDIAQDILGQNVYSNWLSPESGERVSLVEEPPVSARISGALRRSGDHPRGRMSSATTFDETTPTADAGGVSNLGSTLRPDTLSVRPKTATRWLLPAIGGGLVIVGALAWLLWPHGNAAHETTQAASEVPAAVDHAASGHAAEEHAKQPVDQAGSSAEPSARPAPQPSASAEEASQGAAKAEKSAKASKSGTSAKPAATASKAGSKPEAKPAAQPEAKPAAKPSEPSKPKLGSDLGF